MTPALSRPIRAVLPVLGILSVLLAWSVSSRTWSQSLPSPAKTWEASRPYVAEPFAKRGEMDQGVLRFAWYSLVLVAKGYALALLLGTPLGFLLGLSPFFQRSFDPVIQLLRPVSPLAWLVIVAVEMLTGAPGIGGFLWQEYNSLIYEHIILCILTIGVIGFALDQAMSAVERRFRLA